MVSVPLSDNGENAGGGRRGVGQGRNDQEPNFEALPDSIPPQNLEAEEAVLHAGDVRERRGLDEDADALALAGRRHGGGVVRGRRGDARGDARGDGRDGRDAGEARPDDLAGDSIVFARAG